MSRLIRFLPLLALLAAAPATAQNPAPADSAPPLGTAVMSGRVLDGLSGEPVPGVSVYIHELRRMTTTDEYGGFVLTQLPEGSYRWSFRRLGYAAWESESEVRNGDWFTVRILPQPEVLAGVTVVLDGFERRRRAVPAAVRAIGEMEIATSGAGNAFQLVMTRGGISVVSCGDDLFSCVAYRGGMVRPAIYVDDQRFDGGLRELGIFGLPEIHLVEVLRGTMGVAIFVTTRAHAERLARNRRRPDPFFLNDMGRFTGGNSMQPGPNLPRQ